MNTRAGQDRRPEARFPEQSSGEDRDCWLSFARGPTVGSRSEFTEQPRPTLTSARNILRAGLVVGSGGVLVDDARCHVAQFDVAVLRQVAQPLKRFLRRATVPGDQDSLC